MSAGGFLDACGFIPASAGTGNFVVSSAVQGYQTPANANAIGGTPYSYRAQSSDLTQWEEGYGDYTVSGTTLARTTITANSLGTTAAVNFSAAPNVFITAATADLQNASLLNSGSVPAAQLVNAGMLTDIRMARALSLTTSGRMGYPTNGNEYKGVYTGFVNNGDGLQGGLSSNGIYDTTSKTWTPSRANQSSVYGTAFTSLSGWAVAGNGTVTITTATGQPALPDAAWFQAGATVGNLAQISRNVGSIPASFGLSYQSQNVAIGTNTADALNIQVANVNGSVLEIRQNDNSLAIFINGAFTQIWAASFGNFGSEIWFEVNWNSGSNYTINLYLGTQYVATMTGNLPGGGTNGNVVAYLENGVTASRQAWLYFLNIGSSALPANMTLYGTLMQVNTAPNTITVLALVEDDTVSVVPGSTLFIDVTCDGSTYTNVGNLADLGVITAGLIDNTKNVSAFGGSVAVSGFTTGAHLGWRLRTQPQASGAGSSVFTPIWGVALQVT